MPVLGLAGRHWRKWKLVQVHGGDQSPLPPLWNSFVGTGIHNGPVPPANLMLKQEKRERSFTSMQMVHAHTSPLQFKGRGVLAISSPTPFIGTLVAGTEKPLATLLCGGLVDRRFCLRCGGWRLRLLQNTWSLFDFNSISFFTDVPSPWTVGDLWVHYDGVFALYYLVQWVGSTFSDWPGASILDLERNWVLLSPDAAATSADQRVLLSWLLQIFLSELLWRLFEPFGTLLANKYYLAKGWFWTYCIPVPIPEVGHVCGPAALLHRVPHCACLERPWHLLN